MRLLSLDISTVATGWAIFDDGKIAHSGLIEPDRNLSDSARYYWITHHVTGLIKMYKPNDVVIEDTFYLKDPTVLKKLNRIAGQVMYIWYSMSGKSPYFYMAVQARKSIPELKGNAKKEEIVEAVNKFFGLRGKLTDDNIADAIVTGYHHFVVSSNDGGRQVPLDPKTTDIKKEKHRRKLRG